MQVIFEELADDFNVLIKAQTSSSFSMIFALFYDQLTKERDSFETTSTLDMMPFCLIIGRTLRLSSTFRLGALIEKTRWLARRGSYLVSFGIFLSSKAMESIQGERARQLARVNPTGPQPAIITCVATFLMQKNPIQYEQTQKQSPQQLQNYTMNRQFTRRRRDKGTQVNKRPAHTQGTKYGEKRVGLLLMIIMSDLDEGTFLTKQNIMRKIYDRKEKFLASVPPFVYECLRKIEELEPSPSSLDLEFSPMYTHLLVSSNIFYIFEKMTWITSQFISQKALRFVFHKELNKEIRPVQTFSMKDLPLKIQDFQLFKGTPPIAVLNLGHRIVGMTVSTIRQEQKQLFNYQLSSKAEKYLIQKDSLFVLLRNGNIIFGKMGEELDLLDTGKAKYQELRLCGSDVLVLTRSFVIKIIGTNGNPKKIIRAGVEISNIIPIYISTNMYVMMAEQDGKTCLLNCYKSGKNNYLQACPEGLERIQETLYIGKWILLRTVTQKIYAFALVKDSPVTVFEIYNGISPSLLKVLHRKLTQA